MIHRAPARVHGSVAPRPAAASDHTQVSCSWATNARWRKRWFDAPSAEVWGFQRGSWRRIENQKTIHVQHYLKFSTNIRSLPDWSYWVYRIDLLSGETDR